MPRLTRRHALVLPLAGLAATFARTVRAQGDWPSRPVTVIVPFAPSGGADVVSRIVFAQATPADGPGFVIENRAGAGGNIGAAALAHATPDGYTIGTIAISTHGVNPSPVAQSNISPATLLLMWQIERARGNKNADGRIAALCRQLGIEDEFGS